jgi:hypothetical protein
MYSKYNPRTDFRNFIDLYYSGEKDLLFNASIVEKLDVNGQEFLLLEDSCGLKEAYRVKNAPELTSNKHSYLFLNKYYRERMHIHSLFDYYMDLVHMTKMTAEMFGNNENDADGYI